jgi:hypothetical protein
LVVGRREAERIEIRAGGRSPALTQANVEQANVEQANAEPAHARRIGRFAGGSAAAPPRSCRCPNCAS